MKTLFWVDGDDAWEPPFFPHLVDLGLVVVHVLVGEVGEPTLALEEIVNGLPLATASGDHAGRAVEADYAVFDLVLHPDSGLDSEHAQLVGVHGVEVPALGAGVVGVDEGRAAQREGFPDLVHQVHGVGGATGRNVADSWVAY